MADNNLSNTSQRVGIVKGAILKHVVPKEKIGKFCMNKPMPKNAGTQMLFRRWLPTGATVNSPNKWDVQPGAHRINEGETPVASQIVPQDIPVVLDQYAFIYRWSDRVEDLHEDDVPAETKRIAGQRAGLLLEMIKWGKAKACTNVYYAAGVASRSLVNGLVSATLIANIVRGLENNMAELVTSALKASTGYETRAIDSCYVGLTHPDMRYDLEQLPELREGQGLPWRRGRHDRPGRDRRAGQGPLHPVAALHAVPAGRHHGHRQHPLDQRRCQCRRRGQLRRVSDRDHGPRGPGLGRLPWRQQHAGQLQARHRSDQGRHPGAKGCPGHEVLQRCRDPQQLPHGSC